MKKIFIFILLGAVTSDAWAVAPATTCPSGYVAIVEDAFMITNGACPDTTISIGMPTTCLVASPSGTCFLYAEKNIDYTDTTGTFQFSDICPLT